MPVYFFTYHAYRSWMPDHPNGYTRRREGVVPPDEHMADLYRSAALSDEAVFDEPIQRALIDEARQAVIHQRLHLHGASTEASHIHLLVSWSEERHWMKVRSSLKTSLSRKLTEESKDRSRDIRLSRGAGHRRVEDRDHFNHLMRRYMPDHRGVKWFEDRGWSSG